MDVALNDAIARLPIFVTAAVNGMVTLARGGASRQELAQVVKQTLLAWPEKAKI